MSDTIFSSSLGSHKRELSSSKHNSCNSFCTLFAYHSLSCFLHSINFSGWMLRPCPCMAQRQRGWLGKRVRKYFEHHLVASTFNHVREFRLIQVRLQANLLSLDCSSDIFFLWDMPLWSVWGFPAISYIISHMILSLWDFPVISDYYNIRYFFPMIISLWDFPAIRLQVHIQSLKSLFSFKPRAQVGSQG